jgi:F-type H+-transporting ATPase subunit delta
MASLTSRYARAFADVVIDLRLDAGVVREELRQMVGIVGSSADLRKVWESPAVPQEQKIKLLDAIADRAKFISPVRNFMAVLIDHRRVPLLPRIAQQFDRELDERLGLVDADVTSARTLTNEQKLHLELRIERMTGKKVRARYSTDRSILGGAVVKLGSTVYDGSVRGQLRRIKEQLSAG